MEFKKILFILLTVFLIYITYSNCMVIYNSGTNISTYKAILFGTYFTICLTGIFAFSGFAFPTYKLLPESYYKISHPELLKKIYAALGVLYFSKAVVAIFYNKKKIKETYFNTDSQGITAFANQTKQDEFGHIVPFVIITLYAIYLLISKNYVLSISIIVSNIVFNLYPVLMQRYHRTYKATT